MKLLCWTAEDFAFCLLWCHGALFLTACTQSVLKQSNLHRAVQSALIAWPCSFHTAPHWCIQTVFEIWSAPCSSPAPYPSPSLPPAPASWPVWGCNSILEQQEQVKRQTWTLYPRREIKWSASSRCCRQKMLQTDTEKTQRKNVAVFVFWHLCFSASQWDLSCKLLKRK